MRFVSSGPLEKKKENPEMGKSGCVDAILASLSDEPKRKMFYLSPNAVKTSRPEDISPSLWPLPVE